MARKTIHVDALRQQVNTMLAAPGSTHEGRKALCTLVESVLMDADAYRGFQFITPDNRVDYNGCVADPNHPDHSRRRYY